MKDLAVKYGSALTRALQLERLSNVKSADV